MSYLVLARKWRPQTFEEVVGQIHATRTLQNAITSGRVAHGYLFTGPRGVGKTSTARILAKALNCAKGPTPQPCGECDSCREVKGGSNVDVIEIDGASNRGIDDIRELRERVQYAGVRDRYKVYIVDEVHMLTKEAFNALLKTLEEPPAHVIFIFATTEAHKVPATILSRTQRFDFRRIGTRDLTQQLKKILDAEGVVSSADALFMVARAAGGSMRDAQTLLDQVISYSGAGSQGTVSLTAEDVLQVLGGVQEGQAAAALMSGLAGDMGRAFEWTRQLYERGADFRLALETLQDLLRGLLLIKTAPDAASEQGELLPETLQALRLGAEGVGLNRVLTLLKHADEAEARMRFGSHPRLALEVFLVKLAAAQPQASLGELFDELGALEKRLAQGGQAVSVAAAPALPGPVAKIAQSESDPVVEAAPLKSLEVPPSAGFEIEPVAPEAPKGVLDLAEVQAVWEAVIEAVTGKDSFAGSCVRGAELSVLEGDELVLKVRNSKQKEVLEGKVALSLMQDALRLSLGKALKVKVLLVQAQGKAVASVREVQGKPSAEEVAKALSAAPAIKKIQDMFGAEIIEIRRP